MQFCNTTMAGNLTVFYGCMFAGKTTALINFLSQSAYKPSEILVLKPSIDNRASKDKINTHTGITLPCIGIDKDTILDDLITPFTKLIAIDEAQFFDKLIFSELKRYLTKGVNITVAGLDKDYLARPFGIMPMLIGIATAKHQLFAACQVCQAQATHTYRKADNKVLVLIGAANEYEARCESCYQL